ncbi:MAG: trypsin-like peptidase domain-containing protein [Candidatus Obscuribacterales bacterium]|nr:trypsin-like peptidase domain-containing protein [Candidatus Obscuribacterales bacterium]
MADERDDDVPIYFSPGDENIELEEFDAKALLKDEAPAHEWDRYKPAKTLEQASEEASMAGEVKIRGMRNRRMNGKTGEVSDSDKKTRTQSMTYTRLKQITQQSSSELPIARASYNGPMPDADEPGQAEDTIASRNSNAIGTGEFRTMSEPGTISNIWKLVLGLLALNVFAVGIWCGSFMFPSQSNVSSLYEGESVEVDSRKKGKKFRMLKGDTTVADVVERLNPVVVNIDTRYAHEGGRRPAGPGLSQASGLIIRSDGYIITNNHVIPNNTQIRVTLDDKREYVAKIVGRDAYTDLAVIKINANNLQVAPFGSVEDLRPGDWAIVIGSPYGYDHSVTVGVVSALNRQVNDFNHHVSFIQTDAAINPGNSGGPMVNIDGQVIGISTAAVQSGARGIAFSIPIDTANEVAKKLISEGSIARPYLGLYMKDIDPNRKKAQSLPGSPVAVAVHKVVNEGPGDRAGFLPADLITKVNGTPVHSSDEVRAFIRAGKPGDQIDMDIVRRGSAMKLKVILGTYPTSM